jgi:ferric-dicitrate binding protein FerR (iron transport regulator)
MKPDENNHEEIIRKADRIAYLIAGHLQGTLTEEEGNELDDWITENDENLELFEKLTDEENIEIGLQRYMQLERQKAEALVNLKETIGLKQKKRSVRKIWPYLVAASVVLVAITVFVLRPGNTKEKAREPIAQSLESDIKPGVDKAVLTLSNGRTIILDSTATGLLANEGEISVKKLVDGELSYTGADNQMRYNTVATPRGGQYKLVLGDGTKVWLNAESTLKFPAGFTGHQRSVELQGEAFFEVAKNSDMPFKVKINTPDGDGGTVEVLGTEFNINSYADEGAVKATLKKGSVKVEKNGVIKMLRPGEEAIIDTDIKIIEANVNEVIAWKEGKFLFRDETIQSIGEQIRRWYDVDVEYQGKITQHFNTEVSRNAPLLKLLNGLEGTGQVRFTLEGKKLIIKP